MLALFHSPALRRFFGAHLQSQLGSGAAYVALVLIGYQRLHSGWAVSLVLLADFLPGIALSAFFGALADRVSRRRLAIGADLLRAGAFIALALVSSFAATVALALVAGVGSAMFRPAVNAALPALVRPDQRSAATALYGAIINVGMTLGPALTALLLLVSSPALILACNGATFLLSAVLLRKVSLGGQDESGEEAASLWSATRDGVHAVIGIAGMKALLLIGAMTVLAGALMNVAEPLLATGPLHAGNAGYSLLVAVYGVGLVAGSVINARASSSVASLRVRWLLGVALSGAGMLGSAAAPSLGWAIASFALTGLSNTLILGPEVRLLQELVNAGLLGRVFGLRDMLANVAFVTAFVAAGVMLSSVGARAVFALGGGSLIALTVFAVMAFRPQRSGPVVEAVGDLSRAEPVAR